MILLAIETATIGVGVTLIEEAVVLATFSARPGRRHAETLHPAIASVLSSVGASVGDLDAVAVDVGPGLFTGLRVGVSAAKALTFALGVPAVEATSTELLRRGAPVAGRPVVPVVDMRRGEVAFELPGDAEIRVTSPDELIAELNKEMALERALLVGDGALRHAEAILSAGPAGVEIADDAHAAPDATVLAHLGIERLHRGEVCDAFALAPRYHRQADVRISWATRDDPPGGAR
ncbi:MAG TPA: tRNA (adenosine(37)-N6)-threonylcarbamoyltransferase complex dimerization subunit type 1 TsaB [Acidimicrobiales bacterium]|nr:tRNA (adenosine(37)-N6)-threonylcarbamoyltransferase complex dimerization subunit type 1 TsaB [Acidimicrobiales bacterium]